MCRLVWQQDYTKTTELRSHHTCAADEPQNRPHSVLVQMLIKGHFQEFYCVFVHCEIDLDKVS